MYLPNICFIISQKTTKISNLSCFDSSLEKIFKNLKSIRFFGTAESIIIDILKKCQKIEDLIIYCEDFPCKSFLIFLLLINTKRLTKRISDD